MSTSDLRKGELRNGTRLEEEAPVAQQELDAEAVKMMRRMGIPAAEVAEWLSDAQRRRRS